MSRDFANSTYKVSHFYANSTTGDDANDGLSSSTAKATLDGVVSLIPALLSHHCVINLSGTFTLTSHVFINFTSKNNVNFIIDGGSGLTTVAGPFSATSSTTMSLTASGAAWGVDDYKGLFVKVTGGAEDGQLRLIHSNTADTLNVGYKYASSPGAIDFTIVKPSTIITAGSYYYLNVAGVGSKIVSLQRLNIAGSAIIGQSSHQTTNWNQMAQCVMEGNSYMTALGVYNIFGVNNWRLDPSAPNNWDYSLDWTGVGHIGSQDYGIRSYRNNVAAYGYIAKGGIQIYGPSTLSLGYGSNIENLEVLSVANENTMIQDQTASGYATTTIKGGAGVGVSAKNSKIIIAANTYIGNHASHGIEAVNAEIEFLGVTAGSSNGGAGLYAHSGSQVTVKTGSIPTITGTVGDVAISDAATEEISWSDLDTASGITIADEQTMIKEVA